MDYDFFFIHYETPGIEVVELSSLALPSFEAPISFINNIMTTFSSD